MKLVALDEQKLEVLISLLGPTVKRLNADGESDAAKKLTELRKYFRARIEQGPEVPTASSMGQKGGCARSRDKRDAARANGNLGGRPGSYYARLVVATETGDEPAQAVHYKFGNRKERDSWLQGPGLRQAVSSLDWDLKTAVQQKYSNPERLDFEYERTSNTTEHCDGCDEVFERKYGETFGEVTLCPGCIGAKRYVRSPEPWKRH